MNSNKIVIADIGNSRTKVKHNNQFRIFENDSSELIEYVISLPKSNIEAIYYSSVNSYQEEIIVELLENQINLVENVRSIINVNSPINFSNIKGIGTDRILSLLAVYKITETSVVTVDCGTAVTVNLLDEENELLGGVILPGYYTQARALNLYTADLPLIKDIKSEGYIGKNTEDAIKYGILSSIIGAIKTTIDHSSFSSAPNIFVTGGYGSTIRDKLLNYYPHVTYDEHLVLKGIETLIKTTSKEKQLN